MLYDIQTINVNGRKRDADPGKVAELAESIRDIGLLNPITITPSGDLVAGLHRLEACRLLGHTHIEVWELDVDPLLQELAEIDENIIRNNGTELQQSIWLVRRKEIYEELHPETRQHVAGGKARQETASDKMSFAADTAKKTGKSKRSVERKTKIGKALRGAAKKLKGTPIEDSQKDLLALANMDDDQREEVIEKIAGGEAKNVQEARKQQANVIATSLPSGIYNVIYADPPWEYSNTGVHGAAEHHYSTMTTEAICALLKDQQIQVADNAVLFLWVTNPLLEDAFAVIRSWDFAYKTNIVWVKTDLVKPGGGFYVRGRHELLLICTRGSFTPLDPHISPPIGSVITAPIQDHSTKPDEAYQIIERLYPDCSYIELFARRQREGWEGWGYDYGRE